MTPPTVTSDTVDIDSIEWDKCEEIEESGNRYIVCRLQPAPVRFNADDGPGDDNLAVWVDSFQMATGSIFEKVIGWASQPREFERDYTASEMLSIIRSVFSLNVTEMAEVLRVERPTVYAWASGRTLPQSNNSKRIKAVFRYALFMMSRTSLPLGMLVRESMDHNEKSFVDILSDETLDEQAIFSRIRLALERLAKSPQRLTLRERAIKRGADPRKYSLNNDVNDWITGKRVEPETDE